MQLFLNNWNATLTAPATSGDATLSIEPSLAAKLVGLGAGDYYLLTLAKVEDDIETSWEIVKVTAAVGGTLTVEWQQEGTGPAAWAQGTEIIARATAGSLSNLLQMLAAQAQALSALTTRVAALEQGGPTQGNTLVDGSGNPLINQDGDQLVVAV